MWNRVAIAVLASSLTAAALGQSSATQPATQPASRIAPTHQERLRDYLAVIEGQNAIDVRRTVARELLLHDWPETPPRIATLLGGSNAAARIAVASALADVPDQLEDAYVEPLLGMLADTDSNVRESAAAALAGYPPGKIIRRLKLLVLNPAQSRTARLAGIAALGLMTEYEAAAVLVQVLSDPEPAIAQAAVAALGRSTAQDFNEDPGQAWAWWEEHRGLSREDWQQRQIARLVRKDRDNRRRVDQLEKALGKALESSFLRAAESERINLLATYLNDTASVIRLLGLRLAQQHEAGGQHLPDDLRTRVRELLASPEAREQAAAVRTVASFRESADAAPFVEMLQTGQSRELRLALLNALGHVGSDATSGILLEFAGDADEQYAAEAVGALGRLAERGELAAAARERVVTALLELFERMPTGQAVLRERVLWALGNLDDARCGAAFVTGLRQEENAAVRLTAARGLAVLADPQFADALASAASDPDPGVRRLVVETLASLGSAERHLDSLWERLTAPGETDDNIRQVALRGVVEILARSPTALLEGWCARLPQATPGDRKRALELLERLVKPGPGLEPADHERAGLIQARLAAQYALADRPAEAITAYRAALTELRAADVAASGRVALELLQFALTSGRYDATIALALGEVTTAGDAQAIWRVVQTTIEARLNPEGVEQVLALLTAVEKDPPCTLTAAMTESVGQWRARAAQLKPAAPPATQTAGVPQRQPG